MMIDRILVADDEFMVRQFLEESIRRMDIEVLPAADGTEAIELLRKHDVHMAFVDLKMGEADGMDVLRFCREHSPGTVFVVMTAYGTIETSVEAMKLGAFDFIIKPFSPDQATVLVEKARNWLELTERNGYFQREFESAEQDRNQIIGSSPGMQGIHRLVKRVAPTEATVLITGESGTGKELVAGEIRRLSDPAGDRPYIRMNCAAVPESLLESELFGHEKGAFTGATERRIGRFELADTGILLLDEISEISVGMQAKLLRVLQESEFERVGGNKTVGVKTRVIATTNRDLTEEVRKENFREDLFYRLNVFPIHMPPLRERGEDIMEIAKTFILKQAKKLRREIRFSREALRKMREYPWPGNVRELENVVERVAILADDAVIPPEGLPPEIANPEMYSGKWEADTNLLDLRQIEKRTVHKALRKTNGNRTRAAELLGFSVRTLRNKLNQYEEESDNFQEEWKILQPKTG